MKTLKTAVLLLLALALAVPAAAQEEDELDEGIGTLYVEIGTWVAQASGLGFQAASLTNPTEPFGTEILGPERGTQAEVRYRLGYSLPKKLGTFMATFYTHEDDNLRLALQSTGDFIYGQIWSPTDVAGFSNDGLADSFDYRARDLVRDYRLDYGREAFRTARGGGSWFIGARRVTHVREQQVAYFAVLPDLPPLPPAAGNRFDLLPQPETATVGSRYTARGLEAGFEFDVALAGDAFRLEGGVAYATLRGDIATEYRGIDWAYYIDYGDGEGPVLIDPSDYGELLGGTFIDDGTEVPFVDLITQESTLVGIQDRQGREVASTALELWVGVRVNVWRFFDLLGGFRQTHYSTAGLDLTTLGEDTRSATYEGFYGALSARF